MTRRLALAIAALLLPAALIAVARAAEAVPGPAPQELIETSARKLLEALDADRALAKRDPARVRKLVDEILPPYFDTDYSARLVLGRIQLERFRKAPTETLLGDARRSLREVDPAALEPRERVELVIGFGETLFLEDKFLAAANIFEPVLGASLLLGADAHARVLDWWATSLDRYAQTRQMADRVEIYARITERMTAELTQDPGSTPAGY